jgi:two-component system, NarL family, response regulator DevR
LALSSSEAVNPRGTVLVADDDAALRETVADILNLQSYNVLQAADGEEALRTLSQQPVDVLLLDMAMPKRDGLSVLQALGSPPPKVILLSAFSYYSREDIERRELGGKVARTLRKPCPPEKLLAAVDETFEECVPSGQSRLRLDLDEEATVLREEASQLRVLIVDDHGVLRAGTRQVLEAAGDIVVVGEADDCGLALGLVEEHHPEVVLIDLRLPDGSGIDLARKLRANYPVVQTVMLTAYDDDHFVMDAFDAGVTGYLLKTMNPDDLVNAIRAASHGTTVVDPTLSRRISSWRGSAARPRLTQRERNIVDLVAQGLSNKAIAARLGVSTRTVEGHLNHVFTKLGVESRTELARFALVSGLSELAPPSQRSGMDRPS